MDLNSRQPSSTGCYWIAVFHGFPAGLTLIFRMMGVLNFAHASFFIAWRPISLTKISIAAWILMGAS